MPRPAPTAAHPRPSSARTRPTAPGLRCAGEHPVPEGRHQRPRRQRCPDGQPGRVRHQGRAAATGSRSPPAAPPSCGCACTGRSRRRPPKTRLGRRALRHGGGGSGGRRGRVLHPAGSAGTTPEQLRVLRQASADWCGASRSTPTTCPAGWTATPASRHRRTRAAASATRAGATSSPSTSSRCPTRGSTRGSPPGTSASTRCLGAPGPGVREVPDAGAAAGVVPAPQRRPPRVRVELRRRQPTGARARRAAVLRRGRQPRPGVPRAGLPEAAGQLHLVAQPRGRRREQRVRRWVPRPGQHQPAGPLEPGGRRPVGAGRRHGLDGVLRHVDARIAVELAEQNPVYDDMVVKFLEQFLQIRRALEEQGLYDETDASSTTGSSTRRASPRRCGCGPSRDSSRCSPPSGCPGRRRRTSSDSGRGSPHPRERLPGTGAPWPAWCARSTRENILVSVLHPDDVRLALEEFLDEDAFLSPHGLRSVSKRYEGARTTPGCRARRSTTSPPSRPRRCSAATRTGAARCGCL